MAGDDEARRGLSFESAEELGTLVARLYVQIRRPLLKGEVSLARMRLLSTLHDAGPQRVRDLAFAEQVRQPTITAMVSAMVHEGWVERNSAADPNDRRAVLVSITPAGVEKLLAQRYVRAKALMAVLNEIGPDERAELEQAMAVMRRLVERLA